MIAEAIQKILELSAPMRENIHGLEYSSKQLVTVAPPLAPAVDVDTLAGFVDLMEAGVNGFDPAGVFIWVESEASVSLAQRVATTYGQRQTHITAKPTKGVTSFPYFNQWGSQEDFIIGLQSHFQPSPDLDYLLKLTAHIDSQQSVKTVDNSVTQEVTVKQGVAFKAETEIKARLSLKPFRTFRELDQPASDFIFRVRDGGKFALFEADGGAWKIAAIAAIASWLSNRLHGSQNEGLPEIPVIS